MDSDKTLIRPRPGGKGNGGGSGGSGDATLIRPRPGGTAPRQGEAAEEAPTTMRPRRSPARDRLKLGEVPRLQRESVVEAASSLLTLAGQIGQVQGSLDATALHRQAVRLVRQFETRAREAEVDEQTLERARYVLCSLIDELVLNAHWGEHSSWSQNSLLQTFHNETYGGERVFAMIEEALGAVRKDRGFLHIAYLALSLGFLGKYRVDPRGREQVERVRSEIYHVLQEARDRRREALSPSARPVRGIRRRLQSYLPLWAMVAVLCLSAFGVYSYLLMDLNRGSDQVRARLAGVVPRPEPEPVPRNGLPPEVLTLRDLLAPEIERGLVAVKGSRNRMRIVLKAPEFFPSGSAEMDPSFHPVLDKIAKALEMVPGQITVAGHTDNRAIRTPRYPSNWHLSLARATAVVKYMDASGNLKGRLVPEGRGASEPIADNATAEGRARNRRVALSVALNGTGSTTAAARADGADGAGNGDKADG